MEIKTKIEIGSALHGKTNTMPGKIFPTYVPYINVMNSGWVPILEKNSYILKNCVINMMEMDIDNKYIAELLLKKKVEELFDCYEKTKFLDIN